MQLKKKFKLKDELPKLIVKYKTFSPQDLRDKILSDYNIAVTPKAVSMWKKRNPEQIKLLGTSVVTEEKQKEVVSGSIYENGTFKALDSVHKWIIEKTPRVSPKFLNQSLNHLKLMCQGKFYTKDKETKKMTEHQIDGWIPKHPDRISVEDAKEFIANVHSAGCTTNGFKIAFRDFYLSREDKTIKPTDIDGETSEVGKWKYVVVEKALLQEILAYIKERNYLAYVCDFAMYKTGTRIEATLSDFSKSNLTQEAGIAEMHITDKGFHRKGRQKWAKIVPDDLLKEFENIWNTISKDRLFESLDPQELRELNKEAYRIYLKDQPKALELGLSDPCHFWRHMFAQHMLRASAWNYELVAYMGGWNGIDIIRRCYAAPAVEMLKKAGLQYVPNI